MARKVGGKLQRPAAPPGPLELLPPPKGRKKPGPTLYGAGRTKRCQKGARQRFRPQGKARAHGLRARAAKTARRGLLPQAALSHCCAPTNLRVAPPCAQHLKDLLGAGDDVVLGLAGKHVEEGGIACHPDDQIPVLFRMDLGVQ